MPEEIAPAAVPPVISTETIPAVTHGGSASEKTSVDITPTRAISAAEKLGLKKGQIMGPKDALGKSATPQSEVKADIKRLRDKFTPKLNVPRADETPKPSGKLADRQRDEKGRVLPKAETTTPPAPEQKKTVTPPPAPAKIKIGDKEMTPEEIEAQLKELREKAEAKVEPPKPETKEPDAKEQEKADQQRQAEVAERRTKFITENAKHFAPNERDLDVILAGGKPAVEMLGKLLATNHARESERLADAVNEVLRERDNLLKPILDERKEIESYRTESAFLESHPAIKAHAKGIEESRAVRHAMASYYDQIQQKIAQGNASAEERAHAERYENATAKEFDDSVAAYTRERLGITDAALVPAPEPKPAAPKPEAVAPIKAQPKPPTGQPVGGPSAPTAMNDQQQHIARMRAARV